MTTKPFTLYKSSANTLPLSDKSVQMVVTSPPYFGLRTYDGTQEVEWADGQKCAYGNETSVEEYVKHTIEILREVRRVLKDDGVVFWNVGDSYYCNKRTKTDKASKDIPAKSLCLVPERVAVAAQDDGWIVRSIIIWRKPNCVPESIKDRPTSSHETIIMLTKKKKYYWNSKAVQEPSVGGSGQTAAPVKKGKKALLYKSHGTPALSTKTRNLRNVWDIPTQPYSGAHFAVFPEEVPRRCIKAASKPGDTILDPFGGSGTTAKVAVELNRRAVLCDVNYGENGTYQQLAEERINTDRMKQRTKGDKNVKPTVAIIEREFNQEVRNLISEVKTLWKRSNSDVEALSIKMKRLHNISKNFKGDVAKAGVPRSTAYWLLDYGKEKETTNPQPHVSKAQSVSSVGHIKPRTEQLAQPTCQYDPELVARAWQSEDIWTHQDQPLPEAQPPAEPAEPAALPFDTAKKRKKFIFEQAVRALQAGNVYTESLQQEWDEVDQQVRQWLASFAVDNAVPARDINQIQQQEQEN
jgi:site-specific DNA-methyltransferase (cytosine-N4-specific)